MSDTPITPALTPEEWKDAIRDRAGMAEAMQRAWGTDAATGDEHALAALCLIYQPFGFTQEEAEWTRSLAKQWAEYDREWGEDDVRLASSVAAKIAALLPPTP
ncbi:MAG: hypothetical protein JWL61_4984 [Gemmatimonadetes bacterium]|nr:hypothetical protein [Gemmatimonadota bacterium]